MSPEPRDDDKDPREGPPAGREPERPRAKSAKTKQHEVPPHGDALMTRAAEKPPKPAKARSRTAGGGRDGAGEGAGGDGKAIAPAALLPKPSELARLLTGEHTQPHDILGAHALTVGGVSGVVIRALMPNAVAVEAVLEDGRIVPLDATASGIANLYGGFIVGAALPLGYRLR